MIFLFYFLFISIFIYRKHYIHNHKWLPGYTMFAIVCHQFLILIYWVGDIEIICWLSIQHPFFWFFIIILYIISFIIQFNIVHTVLIFHKGTEEIAAKWFQILQNVFSFFLKKNLKLNFNLKNEWYLYQLNYSNYFVSFFYILLNILSIFLIFFRIFFFFFMVFFFFFYCPYFYVSINKLYRKKLHVIFYIFFKVFFFL